MHLTDKEFIERFKNKDKDTFSEIVNNYGDAVYASVFRIVGNKDDAQDIVQNTFLKAFTKSETFRGESSILTFLTSIAINETNMFLRKRKHLLYVDIDSLTNHPHIPASDISTEKKDVKKIFSDAMDKLPFQYREIIVLRDMDGMDTKEVSEILGISQSAVKTKLHRARTLLKTLIKDKKDGLFSD